MQQTPYIWMNGELRPWSEATVHVGTHALHYGTGVFEGIRAYEKDGSAAVFRLREHLERLERSARIYYMELPYSVDELTAAVWQTIEANGLASCYIRPIAFRGYGEMGIYPLNCPVDVVIMTWPWGTYLGADALDKGVRAKISSYRRFGANVLPPAAKACGQYLNSVLAKLEATHAGYQEAILLNEHGHVCEGSGENLFVVRNGVVFTPPVIDSILNGITRDSVMRICRYLDIEVREQSMSRQELYLADEIFMTGTAAEVTPINSIDEHAIGEPGPVTRRVQAAFFDTVGGAQTPWSYFMERPDGSHIEERLAADEREAGRSS